MRGTLMNRKYRRHSPIAAALATAMLLLSPTAHAASCTIVSVVGVALGGYDVFASSPLDTAGNITFHCTSVGANDVIYIHLSRGGSSTFVPRRMAKGGSLLEYNLFLDAARTQVWGDGTGGTSRYGPIKPAEGTNTTLTIYGRAPARQNVGVGAYTDAIVVTLIH
jgi:spore coat protein U-like protein